MGASVAVFVDGEPVADLWGGHVDTARTVAWDRDSITTVWSTTKTMTALCALILADRGDLDLDAPVARYWPEFAAAGKETTRVRHLLGHTAGLPDFDGPIAVEDLFDWPAVTARPAAQAPAWEPGYHSVTFGFLVGEVVRRVTGRTLGTFFAEEVAGPLGADFHIGLGAEHDHRVAPLIPDPRQAAGFPRRRLGFLPRGLAACGTARHQRVRQRPLGRGGAVGTGVRGRLGRRAAVVAGRRRAGLRRAVPRRRPRPRHDDALRHGLPAGEPHVHDGRLRGDHGLALQRQSVATAVRATTSADGPVGIHRPGRPDRTAEEA